MHETAYPRWHGTVSSFLPREGGDPVSAEPPDFPDDQRETTVLTRKKTTTPKRYRVILYNDDYTTMDFVIYILESVFRRSPAEANQIMLKIHKAGSGIAGVYTREIAETKVRLVHDRAKSAQYPLRSGLEEI